MRQEADMKDYFSNNFKDLLEQLLNKNAKTRINIDGVIAHPFFKKIDFQKLENKLIKPPFKPKLAKQAKVSNADKLYLK